MYCFKFDVHVIIHNMLYYIELGRVSTTPYCNYSLLFICYYAFFLVLNGTWHALLGMRHEYKVLFPIAILYFILTICYYISYVVHEVLLTKLSIFEYSYGYCKTYFYLYQLIPSLKYFL